MKPGKFFTPSLYLFFSCLIFLSCSKDKADDDTTPPTIQLSTPANNQTFPAGQPINITGTITDNDRIAEVHIHISNNATSQMLIDIHRYPLVSSYTLNESFQAQAGIPYKIQIIATDRSARQDIETVMVAGL